MRIVYRLSLVALLAALLSLSACKSSKTAAISTVSDGVGKGKKSGLSSNFAANPEITALYFDAATYQANDNWPKAIEKYKAVLEKAPRHATTHFNLADIYFSMGDYEKAQGYAEEALKYMEEPNAWFYRLASLIYTRQREHAKAAQVMEDAVAAFPTETDLMIELAQTYLSQGEYDKVLKLFDRIELKTGPDPDISQRRVEIYKFTEEEDKALEALKKMVEDFPNASEPRQQYIELLMKMGREAEAVALMETQLKETPGDGFALFSLIEYYNEQGQTEKANTLKKQAFDNPKVPLSTKMQYLIEMMRTANGDKDNAEIERFIRSLHNENPDDALLLAMMGELYMQQEKPDSSRRYFRKSLSQDELNKSVWQTLIQLEQNEENWDSLASVTDEALVLYPNDLNFNYFNGVAHLQNESYKKAKRPLEKVLKLDEDNYNLQSQINTMLGDIYHHLDEFNQSKTYYKTAMSLDPSNVTAANNYAYFLAKRDLEIEKALELIEKAIDKSPNNGSFQDTYAYVLYKLARYEEALTWARRAYKNSPSTEVAEHLGDIHNAMGNTTKAREYWQKALDQDKSNTALKTKLDGLK